MQGGGGGGGGMTKKGSQNGRPGKGDSLGPGQKKVISGLSIQEKVDLHTAKNAWKPDRFKDAQTAAAAETGA